MEVGDRLRGYASREEHIERHCSIRNLAKMLAFRDED
jgi:hypothetical protein